MVKITLKSTQYLVRWIGLVLMTPKTCDKHKQRDYNTKSTDAQGILKPKSVIPREEGGFRFFIITRF